MSDTITARTTGTATMEDWDGALSALESRSDVESLESLHVQRRQLLPEYAGLRALHGPGGKWDARRKMILCAIEVRVRMHPPDGMKTTDSAVDALAHGDPQYIAFVEEGIAGATRYIELDTVMSELEEKIRNREFSLTAYSAETRLAR